MNLIPKDALNSTSTSTSTTASQDVTTSRFDSVTTEARTTAASTTSIRVYSTTSRNFAMVTSGENTQESGHSANPDDRQSSTYSIS